MHHFPFSNKAYIKAKADSKQQEFMLDYISKLSKKVAEDEGQLTQHQLQYRCYTIGVMAYRMLNGKGFPEDMENPSLQTPSIINLA